MAETDNHKKVPVEIKRRHIVQWCLLPIVLITIGLGWKYPLLGFSVPVVMTAGFVGGIFRGRYVCGNLCPRGSFFDRILLRVSRGRLSLAHSGTGASDGSSLRR
ncbi:4Fe-4S binding protein [Candidatus Hydrogenedentota bacterium]